MTEYKMTLSTTEPNNYVGLIKIRQDDKYTQTIVAVINENGLPKDLSGRDIFLNAIMPNGYMVRDKVSLVDVAKSELKYTLINSFWQVQGKITAYFTFEQNGQVESTKNFEYQVIRGWMEGIKQGNYIYEFEELARQVMETLNAADFETLESQLESYNSELTSKISLLKTQFDSMDVYTKSQTDSRLLQISTLIDQTKLDIVQIINDQEVELKKEILVKIKNTENRKKKNIHYIAHRGNNTKYPENSLPAFRGTQNHWGIETDVQVTKDGKWVVMHDSTVDRMTNGTGNIKDLTYAQIKALLIDSGVITGLSNDDRRVPSLDEYLFICKKYNKVPVIEIKDEVYTSENYDELVNSLKMLGLEKASVIISFGLSHLQEIKQRLPYTSVQFLVNSIDDNIIDQASSLGYGSGISVYNAHQSVTAENIRKCHDKDLEVCVWTVPFSDFDAAIQKGVDYITTDSESGDLKKYTPTLQNSFTYRESGVVSGNSIEEIGGGQFRVNLVVENGVNTLDTIIATLPDWLVPAKTTWGQAIIRTSSGVQIATVNVYGASRGTQVGQIVVGNAWDARTSWANVNFIYSIN